MVSIFKNASTFHTNVLLQCWFCRKKRFSDFANVFFSFFYSLTIKKRITSVIPRYLTALCDELVSNWFNEEESEM